MARYAWLSRLYLRPQYMLRAGWFQKFLGVSGQKNTTAAGRDWLREAREIEKQKNWHRLVKHCREWVQAEPTESFGWHSLGNAHVFAKQHCNAILAYRQALELKPSAATWGGLAYAYRLLNQTDDAIKALHSKEDVMRNDPEDPLAHDVAAWVGLALVYNSLNQPERMKGAFQEAQLLTSNQPNEEADNWFTIGLAYRNTGQSENVQEVYQRLCVLDRATAERLYDLSAR